MKKEEEGTGEGGHTGQAVNQVGQLLKEQDILLVPPLLDEDKDGTSRTEPGDEVPLEQQGSPDRPGKEQGESAPSSEGREDPVASEEHDGAGQELGDGPIVTPALRDEEDRQELEGQAENQVGQLSKEHDDLLAPPLLVGVGAAAPLEQMGPSVQFQHARRQGGRDGGRADQERLEESQEQEVEKEVKLGGGGDKQAAANVGEGDPGGLLGDEGLTSKKKGSFILKEPAGKLDLPGSSKESQRQQWSMMMRNSRQSQEQVASAEKAKKEASNARKRKKSLAAGNEGGGGGDKLADVRKFWQSRVNHVVEAEVLTRKRKCVDMKLDSGSDGRKKLCVDEKPANCVESEMTDKIKNKVKINIFDSSSSTSAVGGDHGVQADVRGAGVGGGGRGTVQTAHARFSAVQACIGRSGSAAAGQKKLNGATHTMEGS